jgi:hypothetical protein
MQAVAVGVPVVLGGIVGSICFEDQATWYRTLKRPFWEPPPPVFGQVCTLFNLSSKQPPDSVCGWLPETRQQTRLNDTPCCLFQNL